MKIIISVFILLSVFSCIVEKGIIVNKTETEYWEKTITEQTKKYKTEFHYGPDFIWCSDDKNCWHMPDVYSHTLVEEFLFKNNIDYIITIEDKKGNKENYFCPRNIFIELEIGYEFDNHLYNFSLYDENNEKIKIREWKEDIQK